MELFLRFVSVITVVLLIIIILLQQGKGVALGAGFGRGADSGLKNAARPPVNFITKTTSILAMIFFISTFVLTLIISKQESRSAIEELANQGEGITETLPASTVTVDGADIQPTDIPQSAITTEIQSDIVTDTPVDDSAVATQEKGDSESSTSN